MALNITTGSATDIAANAGAILIQVNKALTGNIVVATAASTQYGTATATIATITDPTVGSVYRYGGLANQGKITVTPSTTCDITVTVLSRVS